MSGYPQLLDKLTQQQDPPKTQALKKLIYLSLNDQPNFKTHARQIVSTMSSTLDDIFDEQTKLLAMQLLSQLMSQYKMVIPKDMFHLEDVVVCLSDEKAEIRKASHRLILTFVKKYEKIDEVVNSYREVGEMAGISWKLVQKIIHSFEGLVTFQPQCITYSEDYSNMDNFLTFVIRRTAEDNSLLKKASEQALTSFVKNQYTPQILPKLNNYVSEQLRTHSRTINVKLPQPEDILQQVTIEQQPHRQQPKVKHVTRTQSLSPPKPIPVVDRKSSQLRLNVPDITKQSSEYQSRLMELLERLEMRNVWSIKCQAIQELNRLLINQMVHEVPEILIERVMDLTSDLNFKTCVTSLNTIYYLVMECFQSIRPHLKSIQQILVDKICDMKLAIRQIACKIVKVLAGDKSPHIIRALMQKLSTCSLIGKQQIINLIMDIYTKENFTFQKDREQILYVVSQLASMLYNENTKIKMKTVDALVKISQRTDLEECKRVLVKKLNKVYYDMFINQLRNRNNQMWEDHKNKGMSFQLERPQFAYDKPFNTKKQPYYHVQSQTLSVNSRPDDTFFNETKHHNNRTMNTTNTETISASQGKQGKATASTNFGDFTTMLLGPRNKVPEQRFNLIVKNKYNGTGFSVEHTQDDPLIIRKEDNFNSLTKHQQSSGQAKISYPYKPTLVRRATQQQKKTQEVSQIEDKQRQQQLFVESKEYKYKKPIEQEKLPLAPREERKSNLKLGRGLSRKKPEDKEEVQEEDKKEVAIKPFTKKSSKNQTRNIDYKATHYTSKDQLEPLDNVQQALKKISADIRKQDDWSVQFQTLNYIRRIIKNHQQSLTGLVSSLPTTMPEVLKLVESLRSSLAKNAMITLAEMCESLKRNMDPFLEHIFSKLFKKGLDTNSFIHDEVKKCLTSLCTYCTPQKVIPIILMNCQTKQTQIKLFILLCIQKLTQRTPNNKLQIIRQSNKLASIIGTYIVDSSAQVRTSCKNLFCSIVRQSPKPQVEGIFRRSTSEQSYTKLKTILDKEILATDIVVKISSKKTMDFE